MTRVLRTSVLAAAALAAAACSDSPTTPGARVARGVVVLNGFGQQGVTLVPDTGSATGRINFGPDFDGGSLTVERDTAISTSSRGGGDQLYVAGLANGSLLRVQLPARSNPAGAAFRGPGQFVVALRDSGAVAFVDTRAGAALVVTAYGAGRCPSDVAPRTSELWVLDANLNCDQRAYVPQGDSRLIRASSATLAGRLVSGPGDTLVLAGVRNATGMTVVGNTAYVTSPGVADFSQFPNTVFSQPGSIAQVDLAARRIVRTVSLPTGTYGAGLRVGADDRLYVTAYTNTNFSTQDVFAFDQSLAATGTRAAGKQSLALTLAGGAAPVCAAATADSRGRVYCASNGTGAAATVHVFEPTGTFVRSVPAGQGAVDIAVR